MFTAENAAALMFAADLALSQGLEGFCFRGNPVWFDYSAMEESFGVIAEEYRLESPAEDNVMYIQFSFLNRHHPWIWVE